MTQLPNESWSAPPATLPPIDDDVHIWRVNTTAVTESINLDDTVLSDAERQRARRFHFDQDRHRFVVAHRSLRFILARYLDRSPAKIDYVYGERGKPVLDRSPGDVGLTFNMSHSGEWVLIAVGRDREIGVDIEQIRPDIDLEGISRRFFSPAEVDALFALASNLRDEAFFRCWTRKEAYIKARGGGLSIPLAQFVVSLAPDQPAALLSARD